MRKQQIRTTLLRSSSMSSPRTPVRRAMPVALLGAVALLACAPSALAQTASPLPTGGVFSSGRGQIEQSTPNTMTITQTTGSGVIDWTEFSIATEHQVRIENASGATLNRVMGGQLSRIDGMLTATGSVYLVNPHGVIVGPGGTVLTGGSFVASTRPIDPDAFMAGGPIAAAGTSNGAIRNEGSIASQNGSVVLIARSVSNSGTIAAPHGRATLAAADEVLMATTDGKADGIFVAVASGGAGNVTQEGRIQAAAVALQAADGNVFALAGNRDGLVQATGTATIDGELWLTAPKGTVEVAGVLKATNADGSGGRVTVNGRDVVLAATADIAATGTRGGDVVIGGAAYGTGTDLARTTTIADGARITVGGPAGGGRIETSAKALDIGSATITAGAGGRWLIDPDDLLIDAAAASAIAGSLDSGTDVTQQTFESGTGGVGDITVAAPIVWTGTGDLTFFAFRDLLVNAAISGGGSLFLNAGRDIDIGAAVHSEALIDAVATANVTIGAAGSLSANGNVIVQSANFINQSGPGAVASSGGIWLILSDDAAGSDDGGLLPDYYQYDYANVVGVPAPGNGRYYREAPSVSFTLGPVVKTYDGTVDAILDDTNVNVTGLINGDDFALEGSYATKNAGSGINVTATNFTATRGGIDVYGYDVTTPTVTSAVGTINRAALTAAIVGNPTKTYNATTAVSLTSANFELTGIAAGETINVNSAASASYDSANAGSRTVDATFQTSSFSAGADTLLTNYILPTSATGSGLINAATLLINGVTANNKIYDSTTAATLNTGGATIFGVVGSDAVTLDASAATGVFATKNVGNAIAVTADGFTLTGAAASNYVIAQPTGLAANITPASLVVSGLVANDKIYDGTTTAALNTAGVQFTGLFSGDDVTPGGAGAEINFATKNAGTDIAVTISGLTLSGSDAGNYNVSYADSLSADILQRELTFGFSGSPTKVYDGTTAAFASAGDVALGNVVAGESVTIAQAADLQYASKNVGVWDITGTLTPADYVAGPNTLLANYVLPTSVSAPGEITPAPLDIVIVGNPTKGYDGNANASLGPGNFAVEGFVVGEGATITETSGQYASSDAGVWTISVSLDASDFDTDPGTMMSNYIIPSPVFGPGTITRIPLGPGVVFADITGNPSKIYDGTTVATLTSADYTLGGFIAGEGATITETMGTYDSKDAGLRAVLVLLDPGDFVADPGTNLDNYTLPTQATGTGTIFQKDLTAAIVGNPTKVYNGTVRATVDPANFIIDGVIAGESVTVAPTVTAGYDSKNAGSRIVTANFTANSNFIAGAGTLLSNYVLPTTAVGPGTITPAPLLVLGVGAQNKVYDQTVDATLTGTATLFGTVQGDTVVLEGGSAIGTFATANVGNAITVTVAGYDITGADSANYQLFQPDGLSANITPRGLTIIDLLALDKVYDGTTDAALGGTPTLVGVLGGDTVLLNGTGTTASFLQSNVGTDLSVNVGGFSLFGSDAGNYSLSQPSGLVADITPALLTGAIIGNPTKTYDGTTGVSLTAANYSLTGFVAGEGGSITQSAGAAYDSADAGSRTVSADLVASDFVANAGTLLSNYALPTSITGPGTINQAQLIAAIIGNPTKIYDSTTAATLTSANYQLAGFVAGESATVTETVGTYDQKNVGVRTVTAALGAGDFTAGGGTNLSNYVLPTSASGAGTITPAQVQVVGIVANDKVYDGTTAAMLDSGGGGLTGILGADTVTLVSSDASGTFATKNVGTDIAVTAAGYAIAGADAGNYVVLQPFGLMADIFQATLQVASVTKVYDATTLVPTANGAYTLSGAVAGDDVFVNASGISGNYSDKNVGNNKSVTLAGVAIGGGDSGNYTIASNVSGANIGFITPATLNVVGAVAVSKTYDQNAIAQIDNTNTDLDTVFAGDIVNLTEATTGNFDNANAGTNKPVTTTAYSISGDDAGNYILVQPQGLTADINPLEIFLASVTKVYDGTVNLPTLAGGYTFNGVLSGDTVTAQTTGVTGQYNDNKNVGSGKPVTVEGLTLAGAQGGNYFVAPSITGNIGTITQAPLFAEIVGNPTKTYDGTDVATLASGDYAITGFVAGEGATITEMVGTYDSINQGSRTVTALLDSGDFVALGSTLLTNYMLPTSADGAGMIDPKLLTILGVTADDKVYDGNTDAMLTTAGATLVGVVAGDTTGLDSSGATGVFATRNVGTDIAVTASGFELTDNPFGNYTLEQPVGLMADITAALLSVTQITKVYDATTTLPSNADAYTLDGVVTGDDVVIDTATIGGSYALKDVGTGISVTASNLALAGGDAANYSIATTLNNALIGVITPAILTATIIGPPTKTYDGNTDALLGAGNFQLNGFVGGEGATITQTAGTYDSANAGAQTVTASLTGFYAPNAGTLLSNYVLPTSASGAGLINQALLTASIINTPTKSYDGTSVATLNSTNFLLDGFVGIEGATVTQTTGSYASANAGPRLVTATLTESDFAADSGTLLANYVLPTNASGPGQIDQATLLAAIIGNPTKTYNGNTAATLTSANYEITGFVAGEGASVTETVGTYDSANAGARTVTAILGAGDFAADSGTVLANYVLPTSATGAGTIDQATLMATIIGNPTKTYDGATAATLASGNYSLTGFIAGEGASVTETVGTYDSANAGPRSVTAILDGGDFAPDAGTVLTNYVLPTSASGAGTINQKMLAAAITGNPTKTYDGTAAATLTEADYMLSGFVVGEGASVTQTAGLYGSANAGVRTVTTILAAGDFTADSGTLLANYVLPTSASGAGLINQAVLTATIVGIPTKTYDASNAITLAPTNYSLNGFVAGEGATVLETGGSFADPNAGFHMITASLNSGDFSADGGTLLSNYVLPTSATGVGLIERATLMAAIIGNPTKTYDGTTAATLASGNYSLTGFVAGEGASVTETVGTYDSANAGSRIVTAMLGSADFTANGGTLLTNYVLPTSATGAGTIDQATLMAAIIGNPTKTYDGTTAATLASGNYSLIGFIAGEGASVTETVGTYDSANAGSRIVTAMLGSADFTADSGTLLTNYVLPTSATGAGTIDQATLLAAIIGNPTKTYDGNDVATLTSANYSLTGFVAGEGASVTETVGTYDSANAGSRIVTAMLGADDFTATGSTMLANYVLPTSATGAGTIDQATLMAAIIGNPTKTYDGTTAAALTSANYSLTGFVAGEGASVTETVGTYDSANAGSRIVTAVLGSTDFTADSGTLLTNYALPTSASGLGTIDQATLMAAIIGNPTKTYDGTTAAALTAANYSLTGFIAGEGASVTETVGTYDSANAGARIVTAMLGSADFTANSGTLLTNYVLPTSATGAGTIDQATLMAAIIGNPTKTYDGNDAATLTSANYSLTGFVAGEGASVTETVGTYDSANAGSRMVTAMLGADDFTATGSTMLANYVLPTSATGAGTIDQATLMAAIIGNPTKTYDGTTAATLASGNYSLTGFIAGEGASVTETVGTYDSANAGSRIVTAMLGSADFTANSGTLLTNYVLPTSATGAGTIDQATLMAAIIGNPTKTYDGTTVAALTSANYSLTGFAAGEGASVTETVGTYDSANAGARTVTAMLGADDFTATGSTMLANYVLPTSASGLGTIDQATLLAAIIGNPTKTYDGTTAAALTAANYSLTGFIAGEGASVTETVGTYDSANAGSRIVTAMLGSADFTADSGTLLTNYVLPTSASGVGTIDQATLMAAIIGNPTKTYDGTTAATLTSANYSLTGFIAGEGASVTETVGTYDSANAGPRTVTAMLGSADFAADSGTLLTNYVLPTSASGLGTIDQATLMAAIIGNPTKTYDGTTAAALTAANYSLTGFVAGEGASVTETVGTYDSANAGARMVTAMLGSADFTADSGTLLTNYVLPTSATGAGTIDQATLMAAIIGNPTKTYDGTTAAALTSANYSLTGFVAGEGASVTETVGTYDSANAGSRIVTAMLGADDFTASGGTLLTNYVLPTSASGAGTIDQATLMAAIIGNPTKTYDGNDVATLTSANYSLTGFAAGEGASVTETVGTYDSANAGSRMVTAMLGADDFTATGSTMLANYVLPTSATGAGTIDQATLMAAIIGNPTKTYDGNDVATLTSANYSLTGFAAGEGASVTETVGTYDSANAGSRIVTAILGADDFTATGSTMLANYVLPTSASGGGTIDQATLMAAIIGNPTKTYDGNDVATLTSANYSLTGFIAGEGASVTETVGTYDSANAGSRTVTAMLGADDFTATGSTMLANYVLPTSASGLGTIDQATLLAAIIGNPTKTYDGNDVATLTSANYSLTGFIAGEGASVTETVGTYDSANAGSRIVTAMLGAGDFAADSGTLLSNYVLPTSANGAGTIDQATLMAAIIGNPTKTYDGNDVATLTSVNYSLTGFAAGEGANVTETVGTYDSANAGARTVTAMLGADDFTANSGTMLANYVLPTSASGAGTIDQATLMAAIIGNPTKTYDGTTAATLASGNYSLTGFVAGEGASVTETVGTYDSANAGSRIVTAMLGSADFTASGGTLLSNYVLPTSATGAGTIDQATLMAAIIGNPTKTYDGNDVATLTSANYSLTGFAAGEGASVTETVGTYDSANAGSRTVTAMLGADDFTATGSTMLANYVLPTSASGGGTIDQATLMAAIIGNPTKTYDGTTAATLASGNYSLTGFIAGEGASVTETVGTYDSANAGSRTVTAMLGADDFTATGSTMLANYVLPTSASGLGTIDQATLLAAIIGNPTKTYDGTTAAALASANYSLTGFIAGEGASVTETVGSYDSANAGARIVMAMLGSTDFTADSGTLLTNYVLPTSASGLGTIDQATLMAAIIGNPTKTYDGTTAATLASGNYSLTGFIAGEGASVTETVGTYDSANAGSRIVTAMLGSADFAADSGTLLTNYVLPTSASGLGTIDQATLMAAIIGNPTKTYDGTTAAALTAANYSLTGFVAGEGASVTETVGTYDSANAGARMVTAMLGSADFTADSGTLLTNYVLPTSATGAGTIDQATLMAAIIGNPTKTYDGTTAAALTSANYSLTGFVAGEGASVTETVGTYDSANAGSRTVTAMLGADDFTATGSTMLANYVLPTSASGLGTIDQATLLAAIIGNPTKTYDGTTAATLASGNYSLTGFVAGEGASVTETVGTYDSANAGTRTVTAVLGSADFTADSGTLLSNYVLPTSATGAGTIDQATLMAAIIGNPTKTYDGNDVATLTSANYSLTGFIAGEGASVTETVGTYASPEPGVQPVTAVLDASDYAANSGTLLSNYILPTSATGDGEIIATPPTPCSGGLRDCLPPDLAFDFATSVKARFYIPYPTLFAMYQGTTGGFAALPSIFSPSNLVETPEGILVVGGATIINMGDQILNQTGGSRTIRIFYPPPRPIAFEGLQP